ncbi:hypothetical protein [Microbulbifer magnicolonia]|uniref:hypothetical protein n=1 Tax=Microbulbifer magnicolonia TaxID=3109744 RepID=UPI002B409723|nr:hypothetical protein [Microbulbifer sp. GG15]
MLIDIQHSSERTKGGILNLAHNYPLMASHGGVQDGQRVSENILSAKQLSHIYSPPDRFLAGGLVGLGVQSSHELVKQIGIVGGGGDRERLTDSEREIRLQTRGIALGTDFNGFDWHAAPRFGRYAYYHEDTPADRSNRQRSGRIGAKVNYASYPESSNPWASTKPTCAPACTSWSSRTAEHRPINPSQVTQGSRVTRTFDINYDGLAHYGLIPDFLQEISVLGTSSEQMGAVFRSSEALIQMWEETCFLAYQKRDRPRSLGMGCGPASENQ